MIIDVAYVTPFNVTEFVIIDLLLFESGLKIIPNVVDRMIEVGTEGGQTKCVQFLTNYRGDD